jgi:hypothetical protein
MPPFSNAFLALVWSVCNVRSRTPPVCGLRWYCREAIAGSSSVVRNEFRLAARVPRHVHRQQSLDYRVCSLLQMQRHIEAKGLSRPHVDDEFELDWCLHRKLGRLLALKDAVDIRRSKPK